jgi:hypothetical protein
VAQNNEPLETNDKSLNDEPAAELDDDTEQISLEDANKISGGGFTPYGSGGFSG